MSCTHEIVTIQAGSSGNFIGTHWWNIQESSFCYCPDSSSSLDINHDVMFREGSNLQGDVTYTPRLVLIDLKNNMNSIRRECPLYRYSDEEKSGPLWEGAIDVMKDSPIRKNPFLEEFEKASNSSVNNSVALNAGDSAGLSEASYDFNSPSTVWSDFLKTNLHPKSFCLLDDTVSSEEKNPLDMYSYGHEMYNKYGKETIEDSIRMMTEECDYLQGFHLVFDGHNGFAAVSSQILEHLDDEYHRRPSLCFPVFCDYNISPVQDLKEQMHRLYAVMLSMSSMNAHSTLFSPLSLLDDIIKLSGPFRKFPFIHYDEKLQYQTSAILAAAIETLTSPFRLKSMKFNMYDITSGMSTYGRKLVCSSICLPFPLFDDAYLSTMVEKDVPEYYMTSVSPLYKPDSEKTLYQTSVLRGVPVNKFQKPGKLYHSLEPEEIFGEYLNKYSSSSISTSTVFYEKCCVAPPFPKIFSSRVHTAGVSNLGVEKVPVAASFSSADSASQFIGDLLAEAGKLKFREYVKCAETACEKEDYQEVLESLIGLQENYHNY